MERQIIIPTMQKRISCSSDLKNFITLKFKIASDLNGAEAKPKY